MITPELSTALTMVEQTPPGPDKVRAAEQAALLADELGEPDGVLQARIALVSSRIGIPDDPGDLTMIGWLLNQLDTDVPDRADRWHILWFGKWAMERVINIPEISLEVAHRMLDDVGRRVAAEGYSERPVAQQWTRLSQLTGSTEEIEHWLGRWRTAPRDDLADCFACEASLLGELAAADDDHEEALAIWQPVITGEATCAEQPQVVLGEAVDSLIRTGRVDDAVAAHQRGWRLSKSGPNHAVAMARQLMFGVRAGYVDETVARLLPNLSWSDQLPLATDRMFFCGIAATVLEAGLRTGATPTTIDGEPVRTMIDNHRATAAEIAARFDDRNGSTVMSQQLTAATDPTPYDVAITIPGLVADRAPATTTPGDPIELAESLHVRLDRGASGADLLDSWQRLRSKAEREPTTNEEWRARAYLDRQLGQRTMQDDPDAGRTVLATAREAAERSGDRAEEFLITVVAHGRSDSSDPSAQAEIRGGIDEMVASGDPETAAKALLPLAEWSAPDERGRLLTRSAELFEVAGDHGWALVSRISAVQAAIAAAATTDDPTGERQDADERLRKLQDDALQGGHDFAVVQAMSARGSLAAIDDPGAALGLFAAAEQQASDRDVSFPLWARYGLMTALLDADEFAAAQEVGQELIFHATREQDPKLITYGAWLLAIAEQQLGNPTNAAELIESALPALREIEGAPLGQALWLLGQVLAELDEPGAEAAYDDAADIATTAGAEPAALQARYQAGREAWRHGAADRAEATLDQVIDRAAELDELDLFIAASRIRANAVAERSLEEAVSALLALPARTEELARRTDRLDDLDHTLLAADIERHAAELFAGQGEWAQASDHLDRAEHQLADRYDAVLRVRADRGRYLAEAGRLDEADSLLAEVLPQLDVAERYPATAALCNALALADREEEAQAAWSRYLGD